MIVYDSSLDHQHTTIRKYAKRWFGPYEVENVFDNGTYQLCELDGTILWVPIAGKRVKFFKKRTDDEPYVTLDKTDNEEQLDKDCGDAKSEESGLQLIIYIRGESRVLRMKANNKHREIRHIPKDVRVRRGRVS